MSLRPRMRPRINRAHLLPFRWVFANFSPLEYPPQLFSYFCGSAAWTVVVVIGRPFLPVHWCTNSSHWINCLFCYINPVRWQDFRLLRSDSPGITPLCKHRQFTGPECPCQFSSCLIHVIAVSGSNGCSDSPFQNPTRRARALYRSSFLRYIIVFYLVGIIFVSYNLRPTYDPELGPERSGGMSCHT
jgi:hypothetical protein